MSARHYHGEHELADNPINTTGSVPTEQLLLAALKDMLLAVTPIAVVGLRVMSNAHLDQITERVTANIINCEIAIAHVPGEDDARLIAAAPEMLAALHAIRQAFADGSIKFTTRRQADSDPYHPANSLMCAAITKAEGATA